MDGSNGSSNSPAPFLLKTYEMVDDRYTNSVVSWSQNGRSFVVWNPPEFARDLLPQYFKHNNFSSFIRQLNTYGFRKIDPEQWEFANEEFIQGQRDLLKNIHRRKPVHSHSGQGNAVPLPQSEREEFENKIEKLKQEKLFLESEVERHTQESRGYESQLKSLEQKFQNITHRQRELMLILSQLLQNPSSHSHVMDQSKSPTKKRRLLALNFLQDQGNLEERDTSSLPLFNVEQVERLDTSLTFWNKFVHGIGQTLTADAQDVRMSHLPSTVISGVVASSGDSDLSVPPCSPGYHMSASLSQDYHSSPEHDASATHVESSAISSVCIDIDSRQKPLGIDVNMSPAKISDIEMLENHEQDAANPSVTAGANDVFWEQFLTEAPNSTMTQEVPPTN